MIRRNYKAKAEAVRAALVARGFTSTKEFALHAESAGELCLRFWLGDRRTEVLVLFSEIEQIGLPIFADWLTERVQRARIQPCPIPASDMMHEGVPHHSFTITHGAERVEKLQLERREHRRNAERVESMMRRA